MYSVCHRITGVRYAIKKIPKQSSWKTLNCPYVHDYSLSVFREARALATFSHPHIVRYHTSFIEGEHLYLQLEYCSGGSLEKQLCRSPSSLSSSSSILLLIRQLSSALAYLSSKQPRLIHCNINPSNILCVLPNGEGEREGEIGEIGGGGRRRGQGKKEIIFKLCDFGSIVEEEGDVDMLLDEGIEMGGSEYLPPTLHTITPAVDIFSLGLVAFEMACEGRIEKGKLKEVNHEKEMREYSGAFRGLVKRMIHEDVLVRPKAVELKSLDVSLF